MPELQAMQRPDVTIVIPTRNEAGNIGNVLESIVKFVGDKCRIIVVDASDDATPNLAMAHGVEVIKQRGRGKGSALREVFDGVNSDVIIMLDGDGSLRPEEIPRFVENITIGAEVAKGSRFLSGGHSEDFTFPRKVGNWLFCSLVNLLWSAKYTDLCYGYVAFSKDALEKLKPCLTSKGFQIETEICIKAKKLGLKVVEIPSVELKRVNGKSKIHAVKDSFRILRTIMGERLSYG